MRHNDYPHGRPDKIAAVPSSTAAKMEVRDLLQTKMLPITKGAPRNDEEKRVFITNLIRLQEQRCTAQQCADTLGVSRGTIHNYMRDPLYTEIQNEIISYAKDTGHVTLSDLIDDAISELYNLMHTAKSEFTRFKAIELVLEATGYKMEREQAKTDSREGVKRFLEEVEARRRQQTVVNVQINQMPSDVRVTHDEGTVVESTVPNELVPYQQHVLPGGKLPDSFAQPEDKKKEP